MGRAEDIFDAIANRGVEAIDQFIADAVSEELFLDFKRSADDGVGNSLASDDRKNLGRAISGFGNSEGGVIVWGVAGTIDTKKGDVAGKKRPIVRPARFKSWLEGAVSGVTVPPHSGVRHHVVPSLEPDQGLVATLVPQSNRAPHQTVGDMRYYMRAGSSFMPVPHGVLAGMFGRRPQPILSHRYNLSVSSATKQRGEEVTVVVDLQIENIGLVIGDRIFANVAVRSKPGPFCEVLSNFSPGKGFEHQFTPHHQLCALPGALPLGPGGWTSPFKIVLTLALPINASLAIEGTYGCDGTQINPLGFTIAGSTLEELFQQYCAEQKSLGAQGARENAARKFLDAMTLEPGRS